MPGDQGRKNLRNMFESILQHSFFAFSSANAKQSLNRTVNIKSGNYICLNRWFEVRFRLGRSFTFILVMKT